MKPRVLISMCICLLLMHSHPTAHPIRGDHIVIRDGFPKNIPNAVLNNAFIPFESIKLSEMRVRSEVALRYAHTSVITRVQNPDWRPQEATFSMLLPDTAFISNFTMKLGEKSYVAYVEKKEEATQIYNEAVTKGVSAAHIATKARDSNHFTVTVNVEGNSTAVFDLRYEDFLVRRNGLYNHVINLHPGSFVPKMEVVIRIRESQAITKLFVPEMRTGNEIDATETDLQNSKAVIQYGNNKREATVTFAPDLTEQKRLANIYERKSTDNSSLDTFIGYSSDEDEQIERENNSTLLGQFVIQYDVERINNTEILVNDGYFVHFLAPTSMVPLSKYVVFVLDTSTSMTGRKINQLRNAMEVILSDLNQNDYFNVVEFNSKVTIHDLKEADEVLSVLDIYPSTLRLVPAARASLDNIAKAKLIVSELQASGATNIYNALDVAMNLIRQDVPLREITESPDRNATSNSTDDAANWKDVQPEPIIIFLTDGKANMGEVITPSRIVSLITDKNARGKRASLYTLAFGKKADRSFLRELSLRNDGFMRQIYEAADAELQLRDFYLQVSSPLLSHVKFLYPRKQIIEGSLSCSKFRTINAGAEAAVVGKIADDITEFTPQVRAVRSSPNGIGRKNYEVSSKVAVSHSNDALPLERLWAYLTINQLLKKRDADEDRPTDEESSEQKALTIALKYGFVTPLTSLVVVKPMDIKHIEVDTVSNSSVVHHASPPVMVPIAPTIHPYYVGGHTTRMVAISPRSLHSNTLIGGAWRPQKTSAGAVSSYDNHYDTIRDPTQSMVLITSSTRSQAFGQRKRAKSAGTKSYRKKAYTKSSKNYTNHARPRPRANFGKKKMRDKSPKSRLSGTHFRPNRLNVSRRKSFYSGQLDGIPAKPMFAPAKALSPAEVSTTLRPVDESTSVASKNIVVPIPISPAVQAVPDTLTSQPQMISPRVDYHLEDFDWISPILDSSSNALVIDNNNGNQVILAVTKYINPPKESGGDNECFHSLPQVSQDAIGANATSTDNVCVYVTRCSAAWNISVDDYRNSYCFVNNRYAGVCCPRHKVDVNP